MNEPNAVTRRNRWQNSTLQVDGVDEERKKESLLHWEQQWVKLATEEYSDEKLYAVQASQEHRCEDAIEHATKGIAAHNQSEVLHRFRSVLVAKVGRYDDAVADANRAVELNPLAPKNYHCQAVALQQQRNYPQAGTAYLTAMRRGMQETAEELGCVPLLLPSSSATPPIFLPFPCLLPRLSYTPTTAQHSH